ncbi:MAG: alpha/beta fold hydrolase [Pseudomonadota bacterium]
MAAEGVRGLHVVDRGGHHADPLLFIHGWGISTWAFSEFFDQLAQHYRVIAADLPGFGRSRALGDPVSYERFADTLAELLTGLEIERAHVAGISMGGGVALTFAVRHPQRVRSLVLMAPTGCPDVGLPMLAYTRVAEYLEQVFSPGQAHGKARVSATLFANILRHPATLLATARMIASRRLLEDAERISAPTLLLWGDRDRTIPPRLSKDFAAAIGGAAVEIMPNTFHEMATARPQATAATIHGFISATGA